MVPTGGKNCNRKLFLKKVSISQGPSRNAIVHTIWIVPRVFRKKTLSKDVGRIYGVRGGGSS